MFSFIFGFVYYVFSIYGENVIFVVGWVFLFGFVVVDIMVCSGLFGFVIVMYFVNNIIGILIVGMSGYLFGFVFIVLFFGFDNIELVC